jgi:excisionase family DNA binding protein
MSYLRVSKSTVYRLISSGELQAFKEDGIGEWNILRSDLLAFLESAER